MTSLEKPHPKHHFIILIFLAGIIVLGFGLRFYKPAADPPLWGYVYNTDESHYSYNTLTRLKYGQWFPDEAKFALVTPLFSAFQYFCATFLKNQPDIVRYRAINIVSGILSCLVMAFFINGKWMRFIAVVLASASFLGVVHSRIAIPDMMLTFFLQLTILAAWQSYQQRNFICSYLTGLLSVSCLMIKATGILILPVILLAPLICYTPDSNRKVYWLGVIAGVISGFSLWAVFIIIPFWNEWYHMMSVPFSSNFRYVSFDLTKMIKSYSKLLLSPAFQTMPLLWPLALCWCGASFLPQLKKKKSTFLDSLLFLWILGGIAMVGSASYQPARWHIILFPPVILAGLRFFQSNPGRNIKIFSFLFAGSLSVVYSIFVADRFLEVGEQIHPENGLFSHVIPAAIAFFIIVATYHIIKKFGRESWQAIACAVIVLELSVQSMFHLTFMVPSYYRQSQWTNIATDMEKLMMKKEDIITGDIVQNLRLYSDINILPTYHIQGKVDDESIRNFYSRQNRLPTYYLIIDFKQSKYRADAPRLMKSLQEVQRYSLYIGGVGRRVLHVYRIKSYEWLHSPDNSISQ